MAALSAVACLCFGADEAGVNLKGTRPLGFVEPPP